MAPVLAEAHQAIRRTVREAPKAAPAIPGLGSCVEAAGWCSSLAVPVGEFRLGASAAAGACSSGER
jgi:hypothetical protein